MSKGAPTLDHPARALLAAKAATEATVELLRFQREGFAGNFPFDDPEPVAQLAIALLQTARIERDLFPNSALIHDPVPSAEYLSALGQLAAACAKFLEDECRITIDDEARAA